MNENLKIGDKVTIIEFNGKESTVTIEGVIGAMYLLSNGKKVFIEDLEENYKISKYNLYER